MKQREDETVEIKVKASIGWVYWAYLLSHCGSFVLMLILLS